jgi:hypothetical protein
VKQLTRSVSRQPQGATPAPGERFSPQPFVHAPAAHDSLVGGANSTVGVPHGDLRLFAERGQRGRRLGCCKRVGLVLWEVTRENLAKVRSPDVRFRTGRTRCVAGLVRLPSSGERSCAASPTSSKKAATNTSALMCWAVVCHRRGVCIRGDSRSDPAQRSRASDISWPGVRPPASTTARSRSALGNVTPPSLS